MAGSINRGASEIPNSVASVPSWFRVATAALAVAIFVVDTATEFEVSVSVLYVIVVLMAGRFLQRRGTAMVAGCCLTLTVISAILTAPQGSASIGTANTLISVVAITITAFLVFQNQARGLTLQEQIVDRKRTEEELRASEARFRIFVDHAADAFFVHDGEQGGKVLDVNRQACDSLGYRRDELIGLVPQDFDPDVDAAVLQWVRERIQAGEVCTFETRHRRKDGTIFPVEVRIRPFWQGGQLFHIALARDITERKNAEQKIREQEVELRDVLDLTPLLVAVFGPDRKRLYANRPALDYLGLTLEEWQAVPDPLWFFHPDDRERMAEQVYTGADSDIPHEFEARFRGQGGTHRWFLFRDRPLRDEHGHIKRWYLSATDIEDRKQAEERLRASENRFRTLVDHAADAILLRGEDGKLVDVNRHACESLGYTREELIEMTPRDLVDPNEDPVFFRSVTERLNAGETFAFESGFRRKDGTVFPVEVRVRPFSQAGQRFFLAIARDIADRKRAEEALRASEARFRTFADHASDAFFVHDEHGTILDANREACESLGYTREELIGMHPFDFDRGQASPPSEVTKARLEAGETVTFESVIRRKDGSLYPVEWRIRPYRRGDTRFALSSARDITERKRAEEERERLRQLEADLAHINRVSMLGEMTASIAHEINQPLSGIVSNGEACLLWLESNSPHLEEAREAARRIVRDGNRAGEIVARIRALVKKSAPPKSKLDLNETVREVVALVADEAKRRGITLRAEFAEDLGAVLGDRVQLQQVVLNILINAMEALANSASKRLLLSTSNSGAGQVCITVEDTGPGLDPNMLGRIFDPFYSTKSGGMGMGLSISRSIVQSHGGKLWAAMNEDEGLTVRFTLPQYHDGASVGIA